MHEPAGSYGVYLTFGKSRREETELSRPVYIWTSVTTHEA
jgi:hypothetical protein